MIAAEHNPFSLEAGFLKETMYCNFTSNSVEELASHLFDKSGSQAEYTIDSFYWVRDKIKYTVGLYPHSASETLERRHGSCTNKANLFVALLRACGIPGGFHVMRVDSKQYFGPICPPEIMQFMGSNSIHTYSCVWLDGWVRCDNTDDIALSRGACHLNPPAEPVEFNAIEDARLNIDPAHVHSDSLVPLNSVDSFMEKKARIPEVIPAIFNAFGDFVRAEGNRISSAGEFHNRFFIWLSESNPFLLEEYQVLVKQRAESNN